MWVLRAIRRPITILVGIAVLAACAVGPPVQRPPALAPGAGCHNLTGTYANVSEKLKGHPLSQLFLTMTPLQHLETTDIAIVQKSDTVIAVAARKRGHAILSRAVTVSCKEGRFSVSGPSGWLSEGAGFTALMWRNSKIWLARDDVGALLTEVQESRTGLLMMSIPVATRISRPTQRYRGVTEPAVATMDDIPASRSGGIICSEERVTLCAHGLRLDENGEVVAAQLWWLLLEEEPPADLTHVGLETTTDNQLTLSGWTGTQERVSTSLTTKGFQCRDGVLVPDSIGAKHMSPGTGPTSIFFAGVAGSWRNLTFMQTDDGAMLVRIVEQAAGTVMLVFPFHMDSEDWYRFAPASGPRGWLACPGSDPDQ